MGYRWYAQRECARRAKRDSVVTVCGERDFMPVIGAGGGEVDGRTEPPNSRSAATPF
jgi:hypothetical protein